MNTVSIEVAKELFDLGWKTAGIFVYNNEEKIEHQQGFSYFKGEYALKELRDIKRMHDDVIPAPQFHEIIELLPKLPYQGTAADPLASQDVIFAKTGSGYAIRFSQSDIFVSKTNPHDAAAKLLIWCVKNNYVTL